MSIQKLKKGFTLIELMVVIVIIGILAAIAIPKLFGMSAKAKASEVGPAASTYIKLQQAYTIETGKNPGTAEDIGYSLPGTISSDKKSSTTSNFTYNAATGGSWTAVASGTWLPTSDCSTEGSGGSVGTWAITFSSSAIQAGNGCKSLTPNFMSLANN